MSEFSMIIDVTYTCDWSCDFCSRDLNKPKIKIEDTLNKIRKFENGSDVTLSGGEPGLMNSEEMHQIINLLVEKNCIIYVATNGAFMRNHSDLMDKISMITYHCSEKLDAVIERFDQYTDKIEYVVVVNDTNLPNLDNFLKINKDANSPKISLIGAKKGELRNTEPRYGVGLSFKNKAKVLHIAKKPEYTNTADIMVLFEDIKHIKFIS